MGYPLGGGKQTGAGAQWGLVASRQWLAMAGNGSATWGNGLQPTVRCSAVELIGARCVSGCHAHMGAPHTHHMALDQPLSL